jgi:MoaA/NifB/PqqE/SkfB family radical SAM enzyme
MMNSAPEKSVERESSLRRIAGAILAGEIVPPRMAVVHITNRCNDRCQGCEYEACHASPAEMSSGDLVGVIDGLAELGVSALTLGGGGEPSLHPDFVAIVRHAASRGLEVGVLTNGAGLDGNAIDALVRSASFVRISLDATEPATFARIRGTRESEFARRIDTVKRIVAARNAASSNLEVALKFLLRSTNAEEAPQFVALGEALGVDNVQFKPLRPLGSPDAPSPEEIQRAQRAIDEAHVAHPRVRIRGRMNPVPHSSDRPCLARNLLVVVAADGSVCGCRCFEHRRDTHIYASIHDGASLRDIWYSPAHRDLRVDPSQCGLFDCPCAAQTQALYDSLTNPVQCVGESVPSSTDAQGDTP